MRAVVRASLLSLLILGAGAGISGAAEPVASASTMHPRVVVTFANVPRQSPGPAGSTGRRYTGDGYLLAQSAHADAKRVASKYSLHEVANWPIRALAIHCVVYEILDGRPVTEVLAELQKDSTVALAEPLSEFHTLSDPKVPTASAPYNDPLYDLQTNLPALGIASAHEHSQGSGVRIALIDTGVDTRHPDLRGRIVKTQSFVTHRAPTAASYRHGTAMAGLIAAVANNHIGIVGIAPMAQLEVFEACWQVRPDNDEAVCDTLTLAKALAAALDSGIKLVNMSLAGPRDPLLVALINVAIKRGVTFVGAVAEPADTFPTGISGVIAAQGQQRSLKEDAFSVPANHILTLRPDGQYDFESGTSVAAAELTGIVALLMSSADTRLSTASIVSLLKATAVAGGPAAGSLNVNEALSKLDLEQHRGRVAASDVH
jgi:subtilisin family serine protease